MLKENNHGWVSLNFWPQVILMVHCNTNKDYNWPSFLLFAGARREHSIVSPVTNQ